MTDLTYRPDLYPSVRYVDAFAGIAWLGRVLGFERHFLLPDHAGGVTHAELRLGRGFLMLGSDRDDTNKIRSPRATGGVRTHFVYIAADDTAERFARARREGAAFERDLHETEYGSTEFAVRDPEGHVWSVGTYHPVAGSTPGECVAGLAPELYGGVRYRDARAALAFFERAFGAATEFVAPGEGDAVAHAQVRFGSSLFMLGTDDGRDGATTPGALGGTATGAMYVAFDDVDGVYARAVAAGATVVSAPEDTEYGARMAAVRDLEGYLWSFGDYRVDLGAAEPAAVAAGGA